MTVQELLDKAGPYAVIMVQTADGKLHQVAEAKIDDPIYGLVVTLS
jgi:hypothetical protein